MDLQIIDGFIDYDSNNIATFIMRGIAGHAVVGTYKADGLRSFARVIGNDPLTITIDKDKFIRVPVEANKQLKNELFMIADELDNK